MIKKLQQNQVLKLFFIFLYIFPSQMIIPIENHVLDIFIIYQPSNIYGHYKMSSLSSFQYIWTLEIYISLEIDFLCIFFLLNIIMMKGIRYCCLRCCQYSTQDRYNKFFIKNLIYSLNLSMKDTNISSQPLELEPINKNLHKQI